MAYSRLSRLEEKRSKRQLILSILGIVVLIAIVVTVGIPLLVRGSIFMGNLKSRQPLSTSDDQLAPLAPILSPLATATNSATLKLEGYAEPETNLTIYVNDQTAKESLLDTTGSFSFDDIQLDPGTNTIYATAKDAAGNESPPSEKLQIVYKKDAPKLEVAEPIENQQFGKNQQEITIRGSTDPGVNLTINGRFVRVNDDGSFTFTVRLNDGENTLTVVTRDAAGNETKLERKVTYTP